VGVYVNAFDGKRHSELSGVGFDIEPSQFHGSCNLLLAGISFLIPKTKNDCTPISPVGNV
jgi:hypothetical protein